MAMAELDRQKDQGAMYPPGYDRNAHEDAMGHNDPQPESPMTAEERLEFLVRLGMQAWAEVAPTGPLSLAAREQVFRAALRERMAQAAQVWTAEVER